MKRKQPVKWNIAIFYLHDIKNHTYYFFKDNIDIKNFDPNKIKIDEK